MFARGDVLASIEWFFKLHSEGRDYLTKDEVLRLSESLLFRELFTCCESPEVHC